MADFSDPVAELRRRIEQAKTEPDPTARELALATLEEEVQAAFETFPDSFELNDLRGLVRTYRGDARLQIEGAAHG